MEEFRHGERVLTQVVRVKVEQGVELLTLRKSRQLIALIRQRAWVGSTGVRPDGVDGECEDEAGHWSLDQERQDIPRTADSAHRGGRSVEIWLNTKNLKLLLVTLSFN